MTTTEEQALAAHATGLNCAQSVVATYAGIMQYDKTLAAHLSCGFGSDMGRLQETCGAVTGAFMVLGIHTSRRYPELTDQKNKSYEMIQDFSERFTAIHGTKTCRLLLGCDLKTDEGRAYYKANNLGAEVCCRCIADAVRILDDMLAGQ